MLRFQPASYQFRLLFALCSLLFLSGYGVVAKTTSINAEGAAVADTLPASRIGGSISHIALYDNFAYLYIGYELTIVDIANPAAIVAVGRVENLPSRISDLQVVGNYLYVAIPSSPDELRIYDLAQPTVPRLITTWRHQDSTLGNFNVTVNGNTAYVMLDDGVHLINLADPAAPVEIALIPQRADDIDIVGNYGYMASGGLHVLDLSNPQNIIEVSKTEAPMAVRDGVQSNGALVDVEIVGNYAYGAAENAGLQILDISNPLTPTVVSLLTAIPNAFDVLVQGNYAFVLGISGAFLVDITNPAAPQIVTTPIFLANRTILDSAVRNSTLLVTNGDLYLFDLASATPLAATGFYQSNWYIGGTALATDTVYLGAEDKLYRFDVRNVAQPALQASLALSATLSSVAVAGKYAYSTVGLQGLQIVDLATTDKLSIIGQVAVAGYAQKVKVSGPRAFVLSGPDVERGLTVSVVDIADPHAPKVLGALQSDPTITDFAVAGNYLYVAANTDNEDAFRVFDLSQPATLPKVAGVKQLYISLTLHEGALYAVDFDGNVVNVDITTPAMPKVAWTLKTAGNYVPSLLFLRDQLYVRSLTLDFPSGADHGIQLFALSPSGPPQTLSTIPVDTPCSTLWERNGNLYCFGNENGSLAFSQVTTALYLPAIRTR